MQMQMKLEPAIRINLAKEGIKKPEPRRSAARAFGSCKPIDRLFVSAFKF